MHNRNSKGKEAGGLVGVKNFPSTLNPGFWGKYFEEGNFPTSSRFSNLNIFLNGKVIRLFREREEELLGLTDGFRPGKFRPLALFFRHSILIILQRPFLSRHPSGCWAVCGVRQIDDETNTNTNTKLYSFLPSFLPVFLLNRFQIASDSLFLFTIHSAPVCLSHLPKPAGCPASISSSSSSSLSDLAASDSQ